MKLRRIHLVWAAAATVLSGCETVPSSQVNVLPVTAKVSNASGKTVNSITYQRCGAQSDSWSPVSVGAIPAGSSATFDIPDACVNMQAFYADGKLAGTQSGVRRDFPFSWVIQ